MANEDIFQTGQLNNEEFVPPEINYCVVTVGDRKFTLRIDEVREITDAENILALPGCPEHVKGLIHLRGEVLPVVDLGKIYHSEYRNLSEVKLIIVEYNGEYLALMSDGMPDLAEQSDGEIISMNAFFETYRVK
jgi:purine-binding chemotaxis protein CheW